MNTSLSSLINELTSNMCSSGGSSSKATATCNSLVPRSSSSNKPTFLSPKFISKKDDGKVSATTSQAIAQKRPAPSLSELGPVAKKHKAEAITLPLLAPKGAVVGTTVATSKKAVVGAATPPTPAVKTSLSKRTMVATEILRNMALLPPDKVALFWKQQRDKATPSSQTSSDQKGVIGGEASYGEASHYYRGLFEAIATILTRPEKEASAFVKSTIQSFVGNIGQDTSKRELELQAFEKIAQSLSEQERQDSVFLKAQKKAWSETVIEVPVPEDLIFKAQLERK